MPTDPQQVAAYRRAAIGLGFDESFFLNRIRPITIKEMSEWTGMHPETIRRAINAGEYDGPVIQNGMRGTIRIPVKYAVPWLNHRIDFCGQSKSPG